MTAFPWPLLIAGLLATGLCLLREHGYLRMGKFSSDLGWWVQLTDSDMLRGFRLQWEKYPTTTSSALRWHPPFMSWPRTLRLRIYKLHLSVYLGARA